MFKVSSNVSFLCFVSQTVMFDSRNKGQPKLVYASQDTNRNDRVRTSYKSDVAGHRESEDKKLQSPQLMKVQKSTNQQHPQQYKDEQQQVETQQLGDSGCKNEPAVNKMDVQGDILKTASAQSTNKSPYRPSQQHGPLVETNIKTDEFEGYKIYRGRDNENNREVLAGSEKVQKSSESMITPASTENKSSGHNSVTSGSSQSGYSTHARHPKTNTSSPSIHRRSHTPPQSPSNQQKRQQHLIYQQRRHHTQDVLQDRSRQNTNCVVRSPVIAVRSYSTGRQQQSTAVTMVMQKPGNLGDTWSIPRVPSPASARPQTLTLSSARPQDGGSPGLQQDEREFSNYNPSASPRALRETSRLDSDGTSPQTPSPPPSLSSNPPKSILKNTLSLENPDLYTSPRPILLPRAHSEKNPNYRPKDFDFSAILTTSRDPLSQTSTNSPTLHTKRPVTAGSPQTKYEPGQDGQPARKSVTFSSLVRLHLDNQVSMVRSLSVDA